MFRPRGSMLTAIVTTLGLAGVVLAGTRNVQRTKISPVDRPTKSQKRAVSTRVADGATPVVSAPASTRPTSPAGLGAPANDQCQNAIPIPDGPFPLVTAPVDITEATPQDVNEGYHECAASNGGADRTIWYTFTPSVSGSYVLSTCTGGGATGATVYDTVISVYDSVGGVCPDPGALALACNDTVTGCTTVLPDVPYIDQAVTHPFLEAGHTYFISVGHWTLDTGGVRPGLTDIAILVDVSAAPGNDTCDQPTPLALNRVTEGTTESATNDYRSRGDAACFSGIGQTPTSSAGIDVVFSFTAPADGKYSFRYVQDDSLSPLRSQNPVLYLSDVCPDPAPAGPAGPCIKGANRIAVNAAANGNRSEEIDCVPLTTGQQVFLFFDDVGAGNPGGPLAVEVTTCMREAEPNDDIATATPYPGCFATGSASTVGDVDFYDLGAPPAGSKVFLGVDAAAANDGDFEMRLTNATDTLGYDDNDGTSWTSSNAPVIAGAVADGSELYARINKGSLPAQLAASEPYRLYARIETGVAQNEVDNPENASYYFGNHVTDGGFVRGIMATQVDQDCFRFVANEGDELVVFSDNNPARTPGAITNVWPVLRDLLLAPPTASRFIGQVVRNDVTPSPGTLTGVTPSVTSEFFPYRARYTGTYMACFLPTQDVNQAENPAAGAYPLPYQGSISLNCGPVTAPASRITDVSVTKTGPASPVNTGDIIEYTITLTNTGADIAEDVRLTDTLPAELIYLSLSVDDGFAANNVGCISLPTIGTADAPIDCTNFSIAPGASTTYTLQVQVGNCLGAGVDISNTAVITTLSTDPNAGNDSSTLTLTTQETGSCNDLLCDENGCIANACTANDHCVLGICESTAVDCDDGSLCTEDTCDPATPSGDPCIHDSSQLGDLCDDGNDCTANNCDPTAFCVFPPTAPGSACDDFLNCTTSDACNGTGTCLGHSVCDDGLPCTDDFADELNSCACDNPVSFLGTDCDDSSVCTSGTVCDGTSGGVSACTGGTVLDCNDADPCTDDSCNALTGCVHTPTTCNDGNACTTDTCSSASGCVFTNNANACSDGNACTTVDACSAGVCVGGSPVVCTASDSCHLAGTCAPATGVCTNPAKANGASCDDGNACTTADACNAGAVCVGGPAPICDDSDACTADLCDPASGCVEGDANLDTSGFSSSRVDGRDLIVLADAWNSCPGDSRYDAAANLDHGTGSPGACVDLTDFHLFMNSFGQSCP